MATPDQIDFRAKEIRCAEIARVHVCKIDAAFKGGGLCLTPQEAGIIAKQFARVLLEVATGATLLTPNKEEVQKATAELQEVMECLPSKSP